MAAILNHKSGQTFSVNLISAEDITSATLTSEIRAGDRKIDDLVVTKTGVYTFSLYCADTTQWPTEIPFLEFDVKYAFSDSSIDYSDKFLIRVVDTVTP